MKAAPGWKQRSRNAVQDIAFIGMAAGLVLTVTYLSGSVFSLKFNLGDAVIICLAIVLPLRMALPAAIIGSVLADIFLGGFNYVPFTLVLKGLLVLLASGKWGRSWPVLGMCIGEMALVFGYYGADLVYYGQGVALVDLYWNLVQAGVGVGVGLLFFFTTYRIRPKLSWAGRAP